MDWVELLIRARVCVGGCVGGIYRITRMFCENQTFVNFARVDQFATIKSAKPKLLLVNTHYPCQNAIVRSQRVKFSADLAHSQRFFISKIF